MNTNIIAFAVVVVLVGGAAFYGGTMYSKNAREMRGNFQGQFAGQGGPNGMRGGMGGFTAGEVLSKDETSLTIKMQDGSTKIVLFSGSTMITKSASGTPQDLEQGTRVTVMGAANQDGSLTAQNILIGGGFGMGGMRGPGR